MGWEIDQKSSAIPRWGGIHRDVRKDQVSGKASKQETGLSPCFPVNLTQTGWKYQALLKCFRVTISSQGSQEAGRRQSLQGQEQLRNLEPRNKREQVQEGQCEKYLGIQSKQGHRAALRQNPGPDRSPFAVSFWSKRIDWQSAKIHYHPGLRGCVSLHIRNQIKDFTASQGGKRRKVISWK